MTMHRDRFDRQAELRSQFPPPLAVPFFPGRSGIAPAGQERSVADALVEVLAGLGVEHAFGVFGGGIAPFCESVSRSPIRLIHCRHEAGAAFSAIEASLSTGKPSVVVATTGPGITNLLTGMAAARAEGAKVIIVSGTTNAAQRGRCAFQETTAAGSGFSGLFSSGPLFHLAQIVEDPAELEGLCARLASGVTRTNGFVAHIGLPISVQTASTAPLRPRLTSLPAGGADTDTVASCIELLKQEPFVIWAGFGARAAAAELRQFAELTNARVMCSPRGKGVFPEEHPLYLGVTGLGGHPRPEEYVRAARPARALVLGTRLGEMTSFWSEGLVPREGFVHVDVDREVFGAAYPNATTVGVQAEIRALLSALLDAWPVAEERAPAPSSSPRASVSAVEARAGDRVRPSYLMATLQRVVVETSDAIVLTEAGNSFMLGSSHLRFESAGRYRVSTAFGSMGHAAAGVLGAALARGKAVALVGDGALLMLNEMSTAAQYGVPAVWVVLNDARYGMIARGLESLGFEPFETDFPEADFVAIARGMGVPGITVEREDELAAALEAALRAEGPFVVDVLIDRSEAPVKNRRNDSLISQGASRSEATT
jgi:acetolactate synthase-1/2/3 large subunit